MYLRVLMLVCLVFFSIESYAGVYFHVGGGLDYVKHDKSGNNYPMLNIKGGVGYELSPNFGVELDLTGVSTSKFDGTGTCTTTINAQVTCTKFEEISRQMSIGSLVYSNKFGSTDYFVKGGFGSASSSFVSALNGDGVSEVILIDESDKSFVAVVSAGIVRSDKHRFSGIVSTKYGNSRTGNFGYFGFEYSYLISTKWS